ncbi:MAG: CvpA family protein [Woeseiaceae bacterium]|nr:CvpA family protein [Woeseiaceae bacterium]
MPIIDIVIIVAVTISVIIGIVRGFVKEAISVAALLVAIWAALYFGPSVGKVSDSWIASQDLQLWFGRILIFALILSIGGLLGWGIAKLVRLSILSGMDRLAGTVFGAGRGVLLVALLVLAGEFAGFSNDEWWQRSLLIPYLEQVADWIEVMAPQGYEILVPDEELI